MTPREASEVLFEEPDWREEFDSRCSRWSRLPRHLQEDNSFESVLRDWRRFHLQDGKPATAAQGMIALARLRIFPPRNLIKDMPRDGKCLEEQHDDHCWMIMSQRSWRIVAIEARTLILDSFGEKTQVAIDPLSKWKKYNEKAAEYLESWPK